MIVVRSVYSTNADGSQVDLENTDEEDMPHTFHGPFDSLQDATHFMLNVWPDGDKDLWDQYVEELEMAPEVLNSPESLFGDIKE